MNKRNVKGLIAGAIVSFIACHATSASAGFRMFPAAHCLYQTDYISDYSLTGGDIYNISSGIGARPRVLTCPITTDNTMTPQSLTAVAVDVSDKDVTQEVRAQGCASPLIAGNSRACGAVSTSGIGFDGGWAQLNVDRSTINAPSAFYVHVVVDLPPNSSYTSRLRGVQLVN